MYLLAIALVFALVLTAVGGIAAVGLQIVGPAMDAQPDLYVVQPWPSDVVRFAQAVNVAENSDPAHNNPLDLRPPGWTGPRFGTAGLAVFPSLDEGWHRGFYQIQLIANAVNGRQPASRAGYGPQDTLLDVAKIGRAHV